MKVSLPHGTTKARALEVLQANTPKLVAQFGSGVSDLQQEWRENQLNVSFKTFGFTIQGRLVVEENTAELEVNLPLLARSLEGKTRERVNQVMQEIFGPADSR